MSSIKASPASWYGVEGIIADVDKAGQQLLLCDALPTHSENRDCVGVSLGSDSAFFDNVNLSGDVAPLADLLLVSNLGERAAMVGLVSVHVIDDEAPEIPASELPGSGLCRIWDTAVDSASQPYIDDVEYNDPCLMLPLDTVLVDESGQVLIDHRPQLALDGLSVEMGEFVKLHGTVTSDADADGFSMQTSADVLVELQNPVGYNGTRVLSKTGDILDYTAILVPRMIKMDGVQRLLPIRLRRQWSLSIPIWMTGWLPAER